MESTLALVKMEQVRISLANSANTASPKSPKSLPRNHPSLPDDGEKIRLHLRTWATVLGEAVDQQRQKVSSNSLSRSELSMVSLLLLPSKVSKMPSAPFLMEES
jgi:hypothetical protein